MRFEILPGLPPYGPMALSFTERGEHEFREGLVVRFYPKNSEPWLGNFLGRMTNCTTVLAHPNGTDVIVVAGGHTYIIDPELRAMRDGTRWDDIAAVFALQQLGLVVFQGLVDFAAVRSDNFGWIRPRISWDASGTSKYMEASLRVRHGLRSKPLGCRSRSIS